MSVLDRQMNTPTHTLTHTHTHSLTHSLRAREKGDQRRMKAMPDGQSSAVNLLKGHM